MAKAPDTILLDADIVAYQLAAKAQRVYKFPGMATPAKAVDDWADLPARIDAVVGDLCERLKTVNLIVCLSCPTAENWRLAVLPTYKGNRDYSQRPEHLGPVKDYLEETYPSYRRDTLEADDIMGILSTMKGLPRSLLEANPQFDPQGKKIIASEDKDMGTIPGWLFNPRKDKKPRLVSDLEAEWFHFYQALVGDKVDNYTGLPKCGPVGALAALGDIAVGRKYIYPHEGWRRVVEAYEAKHLTEAEALVQARVARICRATDYDFNRKEVILWSPASPS